MNRDEVILAKKMAAQRKVITCRVRAGSTDILFVQKFKHIFFQICQKSMYFHCISNAFNRESFINKSHTVTLYHFYHSISLIVFKQGRLFLEKQHQIIWYYLMIICQMTTTKKIRNTSILFRIRKNLQLNGRISDFLLRCPLTYYH